MHWTLTDFTRPGNPARTICDEAISETLPGCAQELIVVRFKNRKAVILMQRVLKFLSGKKTKGTVATLIAVIALKLAGQPIPPELIEGLLALAVLFARTGMAADKQETIAALSRKIESEVSK